MSAAESIVDVITEVTETIGIVSHDLSNVKVNTALLVDLLRLELERLDEAIVDLCDQRLGSDVHIEFCHVNSEVSHEISVFVIDFKSN